MCVLLFDETLHRAIQVLAPQSGADIREAVLAPTPQDLPTFTKSALAAWTENIFGLNQDDGRLVRRRQPITFRGVRRSPLLRQFPITTPRSLSEKNVGT